MEFPIFDLVSQGWAVQQRLWGKAQIDKLEWMHSRGRLRALESPGKHQVFEFESCVGLGAVFYWDGDRFVFIGDHTTFLVQPFEAWALPRAIAGSHWAKSLAG